MCRGIVIVSACGASVAEQQGAGTTPLYTSNAYACLGRCNKAKHAFAPINLNAPAFSESGACAPSHDLQWLVALIDQRNQNSTFSPTFVPSSSPSPCPTSTETTVRTTEASTTTPETDTTTTSSIS